MNWLGDSLSKLSLKLDPISQDYLVQLAKTSKNLNSLQRSLADFDDKFKSAPGDQLIEELWLRFGTSKQANPSQLKREIKNYQYLPEVRPSKVQIDQEVRKMKDSQNKTNCKPIRKEDSARNSLAEHAAHNLDKRGARSIVLTKEQKKALIPQLREEARLKYLQKRQPEQFALFKKKVQDEKQLFQPHMLTRTEIQKRKIQEKILTAVENAEKQSRRPESHYLPPQLQEGRQRESVLLSRYKQVQQRAEGVVWQSQQVSRTKARYRTLDKLQTQDQKKYQLIKQDKIQYVKLQVLQEILQKRTVQEQLQERHLRRQLRAEKRRLRAEGCEVSSASASSEEELDGMQKARRGLPIHQYRQQILQLIRDNRVIILIGETGSGKTTQLPQYLYEVGYARQGVIGCTQPRRVAALSVACRVAEELGCRLGDEVGYSIRFQEKTSQRTFIKYMTDGMLIKQLTRDPQLKSYSVMIVDEAHERSLHTDLLLALLKDLSQANPKLKLVISSATLQAQKFSNYFDKAPVIRVPGRRFQVEILYSPEPLTDYVQAAIVTILQIHITHDQGDILCFLTGQEEIQTCIETLNFRIRALGNKVRELIALPIYSSLPVQMQKKIFEPTPAGARKVVIATNIAETSITIDNIVFVVDSGFVKQNNYNPNTSTESLLVTPISKASANQRAGRAGRVCPGKCFRLYTQWSYLHQLQEGTVPEIQRSNLASVVLLLKSMGVENLVDFDFIDPPNHQMLIKAFELLFLLGALNERGQLTRVGRQMAQLPLQPMMSRMVLAGEGRKCIKQIITIASMLSLGGSVFYRPKDKKMHAQKAHKNFIMPGGDHISLLRIYQMWEQNQYSSQWALENYLQAKALNRAKEVREQLQSLCLRTGIDTQDESISQVSNSTYQNVRKCVLEGYFINVARKTKNGYMTMKRNARVWIHPSSLLAKDQPPLVLFSEQVNTSKEYIRTVMQVELDWLREIAGHYYTL